MLDQLMKSLWWRVGRKNAFHTPFDCTYVWTRTAALCLHLHASFQDQWGAIEKQFQRAGCFISLNNINHESVDMFSDFSVIKLIDYRLIETSNPAETARAGVLMKCKMHPKSTLFFLFT